MLDGIEALIALEKYHTVSEAALRLRLTQSAVTKRIQALQQTLNIKLVVPDGRRVKLTSAAFEFLSKARPLVIELKNLSLNSEVQKSNVSHFSLALSDSIAGSFGPYVINKTLEANRGLKLDFHVHRSLMLLENIAIGKYQLGLCTFDELRKDLVSFPLIDEPLSLLYSEQKNKINKNLPLITIEENSATWKSMGTQLKKDYPHFFTKPPIFVESFMAVYQMSRVGLGNGLIPLGLCKELELPKKTYKKLKTTRPISLVTRKTIAQLEVFNLFHQELKKNILQYFGEGIS